MIFFTKNPNIFSLGGGEGAGAWAEGGVVNICEQMFRMALLLFKNNSTKFF